MQLAAMEQRVMGPDVAGRIAAARTSGCDAVIRTCLSGLQWVMLLVPLAILEQRAVASNAASGLQLKKEVALFFRRRDILLWSQSL